jgi:GTP cyclohydrolase I
LTSDNRRSIASSTRTPKQKLEEAAKLIISALGRDIDEEGLKGTPDRVARAWMEDFFPGETPKEALSAMTMDESYDQMLIVRGIAIRSHCEHHLLPWFGNVAIGYIPNKKTVGLSKLTRMVMAAQSGISIQERVTDILANTVQEVLEPMGTMVVIQASHSCTFMRGVKSELQNFTTSATRGVFLTNPAPRQEFLTLLNRS